MTSDYDLVVFDIHTSHDDDFTRHKALGQLILKEQPRTIIFGGDFATLDSCSSYDTIKRCTMKEDLDAIKYAYECIFGPMLKWNARRAKTKHKQYRPRTVFLHGNHEFRERKIRKEDPSGYASLIDFDAMVAPPIYWQEVYDYGDVVNVHGVNYTHCPMSSLGKPMTAISPVTKQTNGHLIFGHTHKMWMQSVPQVGPVNSTRMILNAPAYLPQDSKEHYCRFNTTGWVYGLLRVRPQGPTRPFTYDFLSTEEVEEQYG